MGFKKSYVILVCLSISVVLSSTTDSSGKLDKITRELETLKSTVTMLSTKLNKTETDCARRITGDQQAKGQVTQINHIAFSAYKNQTQSSLNRKHIIKFEKTILNLGNHYHPEDGIFIAPVSGVYLFHCTLINYGDHLFVNIMVGGSVVTTTTAGTGSSYNAGSAMVIANVKKDQHVWIQTCCGSKNEIYGNTLGLEKYFQSTFSGTLLQETND